MHLKFILNKLFNALGECIDIILVTAFFQAGLFV